jgi:L-iditol 2-dehydrogenase
MTEIYGTETMRAAVLKEFGHLSLAHVPIPELEFGEVLCRVAACGMCGTDLKIVNGGFKGTWPPTMPFILGHEWSGEIVKMGPGTERSGLAVGDRVVAENHAGCGSCPLCRMGRYNLCERVREPGFKLYGHTAPGALAEFAARPAIAVHKIPDSVSDVAGALVNQAALTVHAARRADIRPGSTVAVFGPGLLGLLMLQVARAAGATKVYTVGRGERLKTALKLGSTAVIDYEKTDPVAEIRALTDGRGVDYVFDCSGNPSVVEQLLRSTRRGGKISLLGLTGGATAQLPIDLLALDEFDILGVRSSPNCYPATIELMAVGAIRTEPLTTHQYRLDDIAEAFAALESRAVIRPIVLL